MRVLVIIGIFGQVSQIIWNADPNTEGGGVGVNSPNQQKADNARVDRKIYKSDLKSKSWMKACAGAYISKLHKSDVRDIPRISVAPDPLGSCHKPTRDTAVMSPNLIWALLRNSYGRWEFQRL